MGIVVGFISTGQWKNIRQKDLMKKEAGYNLLLVVFLLGGAMITDTLLY